MIQKVFAVRDVKAQAMLQPFFSNASGSAQRAFGDAVLDGKSPISMHPEDYVLYEIGSYDDNSGELIALSPIKMLNVGADFKPAVRVADVGVKEVVGNGS